MAGLIPTFSLSDAGWLRGVRDAISYQGCAIVEGVLSPALLDQIRPALYRVRAAITQEIGDDRLKRAGEIGTLRIPFKFEPVLFELLALEPVLAVVDAILSPTAILHLQNGFILPSFAPDEAPSVFQTKFHADFPRFLNGYLASINVFFAIDDFTKSNGATTVVPGTHQRAEPPSDEYMRENAIAVESPAGSMLVFDSTLWHSAGQNVSGSDRLAINNQFTRSYIKQQIDYVRALGDSVILSLPERTRQLLGWYTRVVTSLDEYYRPADERLYRAGQG